MNLKVEIRRSKSKFYEILENINYVFGFCYLTINVRFSQRPGPMWI